MKKTRILCMFLMLALTAVLFAALPLVSHAAFLEGPCGENVSYTLDAGTLTISGTGAMQDYSSVGTPWYTYGYTIKKVIFQNGVTHIGANACYDCGNLTSVSIPDSVQSIGAQAFRGCGKLTSVYIPQGVTTITSSAFSHTGLTSVTIPDSVTEIADSGFTGCQDLESVNFGTGLVTIGMHAFSYSPKLSNVTIPSKVTSLGLQAFASCTGLESVTLNDGLETIGGECFSNTSSLSSIHIPASVTSIELHAFRMSPAYITVAVENTHYSAREGVLFAGQLETLLHCPISKTGAYEVPAPTTLINELAFLDCSVLEKVIVGRNVTTIGAMAFGSCTSLNTVVLPHSLTRVASRAFESTVNLEQVIYCGTADEWNYKMNFTDHNTLLLNAPRQYHSWVDGVVTTQPTCETAGVQAARCEYCGLVTDEAPIPALGHIWDEGTKTADPTCTQPGNILHVCSRNSGHVWNEEIPALGHDLVHHAGQNVTCTQDGWDAYDTCTRCDYSTYRLIPARGHRWGGATVTKPATTTETGIMTYTCGVCGATKDEIIPVLHVHSYVGTVTKAATCTEPGVMTYMCACGNVYTDVIPATGHTMQHVDAKAATTEAEGCIEHYFCSSCSKYFVHSGEEGGMVEVPVSAVIIPKLVPPHDHNYVETITKPASCKEKGLKTFTCSICGDTYTEEIPLADHTLQHVEAKAATAASEGCIEHWKCTVCGKYFIMENDKLTETTASAVIIPKLGGHTHSYVGTVTKPATCKEKGVMTYTCAGCGNTYSKEIPLADHSYKHVEAKAATAESEGCIEHWVCTVCGKYFIMKDGKYTETTAAAVIIPKLAPVTLPTITVGSRYGRPGKTVDVKIELADNTGIAGATLALAYDSRLTIQSIAAGTALGTLTFTPPGDLTANPVNLLWTGMNEDTSNGTIATITFAIPSDAPDGDYAITITHASDDIFDGDFNDVDAAVVNGGISIISREPGDTSGDGKVNAKDVVLLQRHIAGGYGTALSTSEADLNHDGKVNGKDIVLLQRFIAGGYSVVLE